MRRSIRSALALGLLVAAPATVEARSVSNVSESMIQLYGGSSSYDEETGTWIDVTLYATQQSDGALVELYQSTGTPIMCDGELPGTRYTWFAGLGTGTLAISKSYAAATVSGTVYGETWVFDDCGYAEETVEPTNGDPLDGTSLDVSAEFTATSALVRSKGSGSFKIPGEINQHESSSSVYRAGELHLMAGEDVYHGFGLLGKTTFRHHSNSK